MSNELHKGLEPIIFQGDTTSYRERFRNSSGIRMPDASLVAGMKIGGDMSSFLFPQAAEFQNKPRMRPRGVLLICKDK